MKRAFWNDIRSLAVLVAAISAGLSPQVSAQDKYPSKPVRIIGSFAPGGVLDLMARTVNEKLGSFLGQPVVVEARPGADGSIGTEAVAKATPDGYTLLFAGTPHVTLPAVSNTSWHPTKDFAGIATVGHIPNVVVVPASLPVQSIAEFVNYARARKGEVNSLNGGTAGAQNLNTELFKRAAGIDMTPVGYKGLVLGVPDLLSGALHFAILPPPLIESHVKSGKLRPLAVSSTSRIKQYPAVPTMGEAGYPQASVMGWYALLAPAGTPREVIDRLNREVNRALADPDVLGRIERLNAEPLVGSTPEKVDSMLRTETERWQRLAREAKLRIN